jgi:glycosyltransferase involved in cell wall biosynthesis
MEGHDKRSVLISTEFFVPGFKGGGPIFAAKNLALLLCKHTEVSVVTSGFDLNEYATYSGINLNIWQDREGFSVLYLSRKYLSFLQLGYRLIKLRPEVIYINGIFSFKFSLFIIILRFMRITRAKLIISPRGMLSSECLSKGRLKKIIVLKLLKSTFLSTNTSFHATDVGEAGSIERWFGKKYRIVIEHDVVNIPDELNRMVLAKDVGHLNLLFVGRIHPIKNLHSVLLALTRTSVGAIELRIVGPVENEEYFRACKLIERDLPARVKVHWLGPVEPSKIPALINQTHFSICFSKSENFSYAIVESFLHSRPVIASFGTPWLNLENSRAGFNLESDNITGLTELFDMLVRQCNSDYVKYSFGSYEYIKERYNIDKVRNGYLEIFNLN